MASPDVTPEFGFNVRPQQGKPLDVSAEGRDGLRYVREHGFLKGYASTYNNARRLNGTLNGSMVQEQLRWNRQTAEKFLEHVVNNIRGNIKRKGSSTGRLLEVTAQPGNMRYDSSFWGVGIQTHLDRSSAKYWRTIEEGTRRVWKRSFIGDPLIGIWGHGAPVLGSSARWGTVARGTAPWKRAGQGYGGKFVPLRREARRSSVAASKAWKRATGAKKDNFARVQHHIQPQWAYRNAWRQMGGAKHFEYMMMWTHIPGAVRPGSQFLGYTTHTGKPMLGRR